MGHSSRKWFLALVWCLWGIQKASAGDGSHVYWVSTNGAATYANAESATNLSGAACTTFTAANAGATAGDTVYYRGGDYYLVGTYANGIDPSASGTLSQRITFARYANETVTFVGDEASTLQYGVCLDDQSFIVVDGFNFRNVGRNCTLYPAWSCEVKNCNFYRDEGDTGGTYGILIFDNGTNNWIHNNTIHDMMKSTGCLEGGDGIRIGYWTEATLHCNYNTIESNTIYHIGHATSDDYGMYNIWRNNISHNEGFSPDTLTVRGVVDTFTSIDPTHAKITDTSVDFVTAGVQANHGVYRVFGAGVNDHRIGVVDSISTTVNPNDTVNYSHQYSSFLVYFTNGESYAINSCGFPSDPPGTYPGNGMYAHRNMATTGYESGVEQRLNLFEGNRSGSAGVNPVNGGSEGFMLGSPGNIVRYNAFYGNDGQGITLKWFQDYHSHSGYSNHVYFNTIYGNGQYKIQHSGLALCGIHGYGYASTNNVFKNNIIYSNSGGDYDGVGLTLQHWSNNWCTNAACGGIATSAPVFVDETLTNFSSATIPDFHPTLASPVVDKATALTTADGGGNSTNRLKVIDSKYFHDGTWGSSLCPDYADVIAVETVSNIAGVSNVDYATHTLTLSNSITWTNGASVWLYAKSDGQRVLYGSAPDIGAYEYGSGSTNNASFTGLPTSGNPPLIVTFTNSTANGFTNAYWTFGDGTNTTTTDLTVLHTYLAVGTNTVTLTTAADGASNTLTRAGYVTVTNEVILSKPMIKTGGRIIGSKMRIE